MRIALGDEVHYGAGGVEGQLAAAATQEAVAHHDGGDVATSEPLGGGEWVSTGWLLFCWIVVGFSVWLVLIEAYAYSRKAITTGNHVSTNAACCTYALFASNTPCS